MRINNSLYATALADILRKIESLPDENPDTKLGAITLRAYTNGVSGPHVHATATVALKLHATIHTTEVPVNREWKE